MTGRQHSHVVGGDPVDPMLGGFGAAHDVPATDDDRHLHAALDDVGSAAPRCGAPAR